MNFGRALEILKEGSRVAREGWNGKGMFVYLVGAGRYPPSTDAGYKIAAEQEDGLVPYKPYLAMKTVDGEVVPWLASQTDILADDWKELVTVTAFASDDVLLDDHENVRLSGEFKAEAYQPDKFAKDEQDSSDYEDNDSDEYYVGC